MEAEQESLTFLPHFRKEFSIPMHRNTGSARLFGEVSLKASARSSAEEEDSVKTDLASHEVFFYGPADIDGVNPSAIARVEPSPGTNDFEPNYFPFIEFRDPDFLWRYSLDVTSGAQKTPWLSLLVLSSEELADLSEDGKTAFYQDDRGKWRLTIDPSYFPTNDREDLNALSGHVQLSNFIQNDSAHEDGILDFVHAHPDQCFSRLLCLRRLAPRKSYTLFLVPYYLAGEKQSDDVGPESIFQGREGRVTLPVYFSSTFKTSEKGDFEYLARRLKPDTMSSSTGTVPVVARDQTMGTNYVIHREGALVAPGFFSHRMTYSEQLNQQPNNEDLMDELLENFDVQPPNCSLNEEDPYLAPPYYGKHFQKLDRDITANLGSTPTPRHWSEELNVDQRNRIAAGLGTKVVQNEQEKYLKQCWFQVGDLRLANEKLRRAQACLDLATSLNRRFIKTLDDAQFAAITRPFHGHFKEKGFGRRRSLKERIDLSGLPRGVVQPAFLRMVRQRLPSNDFPLFDPWIDSLESGRENQPLKEESEKSKEFYRKVKHDLGFPLPNIHPLGPIRREKILVDPIDMENTFRSRFNFPEVLRGKMRMSIHFNDDEFKISESFDPLMTSPIIREAMFRPLNALSIEYILPGIDEMQANTVALCEENRLFIESYLCGLNEEIEKELAWNQFPIHQKGTVFSHFWDATMTDSHKKDEFDEPQKITDIRPLHMWKKKHRRRRDSSLGKNPSLAFDNKAVAGRVVLLLRGDLIRRYPDMVIFAQKTATLFSDGGDEVAESITPFFRAKLSNDLLAVGFPFTGEEVAASEVYFVLQEQQELPRFGLDETMDGERDLSWQDVVLNEKGYIVGFHRSLPPDASFLAKGTIQKPIQIVIHSSHMLPNTEADGASHA